jgi:hypothetical protein
MIGFSLFSTVCCTAGRSTLRLVWYILSAFLWFAHSLFVLGNWPTWTGVESRRQLAVRA